MSKRMIMSRVVLAVTSAVLFVSGVIGQESRIEGQGARRHFVSDRYRFLIPVPVGWYVTIVRGTPTFSSFNPDEALPQMRLPNGGATIRIVAQEKLSGRRARADLSTWAREDIKSLAANKASIEPIALPPGTGISGAVVSSYRIATSSPDEQKQNCVTVYWQFEDKLFAAYLSYITGDAEAQKKEELLLQLIRDVRPAEKMLIHR